MSAHCRWIFFGPCNLRKRGPQMDREMGRLSGPSSSAASRSVLSKADMQIDSISSSVIVV